MPGTGRPAVGRGWSGLLGFGESEKGVRLAGVARPWDGTERVGAMLMPARPACLRRADARGKGVISG